MEKNLLREVMRLTKMKGMRKSHATCRDYPVQEGTVSLIVQPCSFQQPLGRPMTSE